MGARGSSARSQPQCEAVRRCAGSKAYVLMAYVHDWRRGIVGVTLYEHVHHVQSLSAASEQQQCRNS
jgi:ATP-dependent Clp protease adapter protein ClpS